MTIFDEIKHERARQMSLGYDKDTDAKNSVNDWLAYIMFYASHSLNSVVDDLGTFRYSMIQTAALAVAAIESVDRKMGRQPA